MGRDRASGLPPRSDARSGPSVTPAAGSGELADDPRTAFEMRNKTGSDVFSAASTMAG